MLMLADLVGDPRGARHELRAGKGADGPPPGRPAPAEGDSAAGSAQAESASNNKRGGHGPCPWRIRTSPGAPTPGGRPLATHPRSRCGCSHARGRLTTRLMTTSNESDAEAPQT